MVEAHRLSPLLLSLCLGLADDCFANSGPAQSFLTAHAESSISAAVNPAGLTRLQGPELLGQVLYFSSESTFRTDDDSFRPNRSSESEASLAIPALFYARPISDSLVFGASVTVPGGFGEDFDDDAPSRYLVDEWATGYVSIAPALAYRVNQRLSLAGGITANYSVLTYESATAG
jgi:long-chain fatty acid transport protein